MIQRIFLIIWLACVGHGFASAQGLDGLFLQMTMRSGRIEENHYFFLPDGRYLNGVPDGGLTPADLERACAKTLKDYCGTYKLSDGSLVLTPRQGHSESLTFERTSDGNLTLGGRFAKHVSSFPADAKLDGKYSRNNSAGPVSYAESYTFRPDGTFSTSSLGAVTTETGAKKSEAAGTGIYRLNGNVLELTANGNTSRIVAYPYSVGKGDVRINLHGQFFRKQ
jgi:hypothetical protein